MPSIKDYIANNIKGSTSLTKREKQVLKYAAIGFTDNKIAETLGISPRTVQCYFTKSQMRLNTLNRTHSVAMFILNSFELDIQKLFDL